MSRTGHGYKWPSCCVVIMLRVVIMLLPAQACLLRLSPSVKRQRQEQEQSRSSGSEARLESGHMITGASCRKIYTKCTFNILQEEFCKKNTAQRQPTPTNADPAWPANSV